MPLAFAYFWKRSIRDPRYRRHMRERFGRGTRISKAIWVHAVSIGEVRSSVPLVRELLGRNERVVVTCLTPAGRSEAEKAFAAYIRSGELAVRYAPLEYEFAFKRFFKECSPSLALVMEVEFWPVMIASARKRGIPIYLCNSQYPEKSFARDRQRGSLRREVLGLVSGAFAKSEIHARRFRDAGVRNVQITGELRFDQPIKTGSVEAAKRCVSAMKLGLPNRPVIAFASVVAGEDTGYIDAMRLIESRCLEEGRPPPLFVYVPRAPERFAEAADILASDAKNMARRSDLFDEDLAVTREAEFADLEILLGDSLGEMNFYLSLADIVIVGGGFVKSGAHNVIEPLALGKPVLVGPSIWTIEYPALEAIEAGAVAKCDTIESLADMAANLLSSTESLIAMKTAAQVFHQSNRGGAGKTVEKLFSAEKKHVESSRRRR
ncbi:MAG: 3-deoxy-D-manno-octulosonic acid transferase [Albidovulum sp.]|nr:3-deoxy-D-manno-octulosonic acid transferase [Albidovulum sp.]